MAESLGVVVIVLDSLRADHVSTELGSRTPFIAELASRGTVFERAVAPATWTLPSHVSMLTGLSPTQHHVQSKGAVRESLAGARAGVAELAASGRYLPAWLRDRGVSTFLGSSIGWLSPASGLSTGFSSVSFVPFPPGRRGQSTPPRAADLGARAGETRLPGVPVPIKHMARTGLELVQEGRRALPMARWAWSGEDKGAGQLQTALARWLEEIRGPFFALVNLIETHDPHIAPVGYGRRDLRSRLAAAGVKRFTRRTNLHNWGYAQLPSRDIQRMKNAYRAETAYADMCVRRISEHLERLGLHDRTTMIVTADHGEALGEHGLIGHGLPLSESVLHVPLVVRGRTTTPERVSGPVGLGSLAASVAKELCDDDAPFGPASLVSPEGRGIARAEMEAPGRYFHSSGLKLREVAPEMNRPAAAFYSGSMKLIVGSFWDEALYDVEKDPSESRNLIGETPVPPELNQMRREWEERTASCD